MSNIIYYGCLYYNMCFCSMRFFLAKQLTVALYNTIKYYNKIYYIL